MTARLFAPSGSQVFSTLISANFGPLFLPVTGTYRLNIDGAGDAIGSYGFVLHDVATAPMPNAGDIAGTLDLHLGSDLFVIDAVAGQTIILSPAADLFVGTAEDISVAARALTAFGNFEDGYEGIDVGLGLGAFRAGAAINVVLVSDEDRDIRDPNLSFAGIFTELASRGAMVNGVHDAFFRDGNNQVALGVDSQGTAYLADGAGGFNTSTGGIFTGTVRPAQTTKADYIDLAWALGGAAWDVNLLRGGGLPAVSFTKAFVEIKAREIEQQLGLNVVASSPAAGFENLTGIVPSITAGDTASFEVKLTGNGAPQTFDLLFVRPGSNLVVGSIPVTINVGDYAYPVQTIDADGDPIAFSLLEAPDGAVIHPTSGRITWAPPSAGVYHFVVQADDGRGGRDTQEYEVNVTIGAPNDPPVITSTAPTEATEEISLAYVVEANDANGDLLSYFLTAAPTGMAIDSSSGRVTWTPALAQIGEHHVTVRVLDGRGGEATQSFTLSVVADTANPQIVSAPITTLLADEVFRYAVEATDPDADALAYDLLVAPAGMAIDADTGLVVWRATKEQIGVESVVLRVRNSRGGVDLQFFQVAVGATGAAPLILPPPPSAPAIANPPYAFRFYAQDANADALTFQLTTTPAGMTIDPASGLLDWKPTTAQIGTHKVAPIRRR